MSKILNDRWLIQQHFGVKRSKKIISQLDQFAVASNLSEISTTPPSRCYLLKGQYKNCFSVDISRNYRLIFEGYDVNDHLSIKRSEVVFIQIVDIVDYH